ncbi:acetyl-coenzyme A transporter 1-like protein [Leptotrombidium deliense]|uniref:Acetyl-coenzyme A transporter 1-like protein n=1 Tax=Leptotrombidium deliense TaxID=299467 RepID=A0A443S871_9ACAR|nr:acetyl-coenzyme A transporter 1-like protein [Leptotrombidium deliense]
MGTAAADSVTSLKLVEYGIKRENIGILKLPLIPLQLILPWIITRFTTKKPLTSFYYLYPFRLLITCVAAFMVWGTYTLRTDAASFSTSFYALIIIGFALVMTSNYATGMTTWCFMAQVSDPLIGGTYMTLLTTVSNLGATEQVTVDGFYVEIVISLLLGLTWMVVMFKAVKWLQKQPKTAWRCK